MRLSVMTQRHAVVDFIGSIQGVETRSHGAPAYNSSRDFDFLLRPNKPYKLSYAFWLEGASDHSLVCRVMARLLREIGVVQITPLWESW
jgi:hypothetical protein